MIRLLDVNVLLALAWPEHSQHEAAHRWFASKRLEGWASCPATQSGFVRLSSARGAVPEPMTPVEAIAAIERSTGHPEHHFWIQDGSVLTIAPEIMERIMGPRQMGDAVLLSLAIKHRGVLATFDRNIQRLLPRDSPLQSHIELIPA
jgi:toxin-antitoxin system PIN domain toxin